MIIDAIKLTLAATGENAIQIIGVSIVQIILPIRSIIKDGLRTENEQILS